MSDTEYDVTANYALKKPFIDQADDEWGVMWNENADLIDNLIKTQIDGMTGLFLPLAGGVLTGMLQLPTDAPTLATHAASKSYVDSQIGGGGAGPFLKLAGGTTTGGVTIGAGAFTVTAGNATVGSGTGAARNLNLVAAAANTRAVQFFSGGSAAANLRWLVAADSSAESGSDAGSNFVIAARSDTGGAPAAGNALTIARSTLGAAFAGTVRTPFLNMGGAAGNGLAAVLSTTTGVPFSQSPLWVNYTFTGTNSAIVNQNFNTITVHDDVVNTGAGASNTLFIQHYAKANARNAGGLWVTTRQEQAPNGPFGWVTPLTASSELSFNCGGTDLTLTGTAGSNTTFNTYTTLKAGAKNVNGCVGYEMDVNCEAGSTFGQKAGLIIARMPTDRAIGAWGYDTAIKFGASGVAASTGWDYMLSFHDPASQVSFKPTATLIYCAGPQTATNGQALAAWGIDLTQLTFSGGLVKTTGFAVDGVGNVVGQKINVGGHSLVPSGSTLEIDQVGQVSSLVSSTPAAGGSGYADGDKVTIAGGGVFSVTTDGSTHVTSVTQLVPAVSTSPPANPVATTPVNNSMFRPGGSGMTLNLSWSSAAGTINIGATKAGVINIGRAASVTTLAGKLKTAVLLTNAANDSAAASAGVGVNEFYRNGSVIMQRAA